MSVYEGNGNYWGLVVQSGPWRTTPVDAARKAARFNPHIGNGLFKGGPQHGGHGNYSTLMLPPIKPERIITRSIITPPLQGGTRNRVGRRRPKKIPTHPYLLPKTETMNAGTQTDFPQGGPPKDYESGSPPVLSVETKGQDVSTSMPELLSATTDSSGMSGVSYGGAFTSEGDTATLQIADRDRIIQQTLAIQPNLVASASQTSPLTPTDQQMATATADYAAQTDALPGPEIAMMADASEQTSPVHTPLALPGLSELDKLIGFKGVDMTGPEKAAIAGDIAGAIESGLSSTPTLPPPKSVVDTPSRLYNTFHTLPSIMEVDEPTPEAGPSQTSAEEEAEIKKKIEKLKASSLTAEQKRVAAMKKKKAAAQDTELNKLIAEARQAAQRLAAEQRKNAKSKKPNFTKENDYKQRKAAADAALKAYKANKGK